MEVSHPQRPPSLLRRLLSGSAWALLGRSIAVPISLLLNALLARLLEPAEFGSYVLVISLTTFGVALGALGLNQLVIRLVAEARTLQPERLTALAKRILLVTTVGGLVTALLLLLTTPWLDTVFFDGRLGERALFVLVAVLVAATTLMRVTVEIFRGLADIRLASFFGGSTLGLLTNLLVLLGVAAIFTLNLQISLTGVVLIVTGATLVALTLALTLLFSYLPQGTESASIPLPALFNESWPLWVNSLMLFVATQADIWILSATTSPQDVAVYGAATRLILFVTMPLLIANAVLPPFIAELNVSGTKADLQRTLQGIATVTGVPALLVIIAFLLIGRQILGLVFGDFYQVAYPVLALLCIGQGANVLAGSCGFTLIMTGYQRDAMIITVLTSVLLISGGVLVTPRYGVIGLSACVAAAIAIQNILLLATARYRVGVWTNINPLAVRQFLMRREAPSSA